MQLGCSSFWERSGPTQLSPGTIPGSAVQPTPVATPGPRFAVGLEGLHAGMAALGDDSGSPVGAQVCALFALSSSFLVHMRHLIRCMLDVCRAEFHLDHISVVLSQGSIHKWH